MARYAIIQNSNETVVNCVEWDGIQSWYIPEGTFIIQSDLANIGDVYDQNSGKFIPQNSLK